MWADFSQWDDQADVAQNIMLHPPTWQGVEHYWLHSEGDLYIPITYTVWSALAVVAQPDNPRAVLNATIFHVANIIVHILSVLVVYAILRLLIGDIFPAAAGAAIFAIHPVQMETVAWISGMKDLLAGLLGMAAVWVYLLGARRKGASVFSWRYALASLLFLAAMLAKPSAVAVPLIVLGVDILMLRRPVKVAIGWALPWILAGCVIAAIGKIVQPAGFANLHVPLAARPLVACDAVAFYLYKLIFPAWLCIDYGRSPSFVLWNAPYYAWWTWIAPVALGIFLWRHRRRWPALAAAGWIFVAGIVPVLGLVRFDFQVTSTVTDHYLYLSMLGPALALAAILRLAANRRLAVGFATVWIAALATRAMFQSAAWMNGQALFTHAVEVNDRSWIAHDNLAALALARFDARTALREANEAMEIDPDERQTFTNLALAEEQLGQLQKAEATFRLALARFPDDPAANETLAAFLLNTGHPAEAARLFSRALELEGDYADAKQGLKQAQTAMEHMHQSP